MRGCSSCRVAEAGFDGSCSCFFFRFFFFLRGSSDSESDGAASGFGRRFAMDGEGFQQTTSGGATTATSR